MGHNSAEYLHTVVECAKLAFADREAYYGDPRFDDVPFDQLLSKDYAAQRCGLVGEQASLEMRPGDLGDGVPAYATFDVAEDNRRALRLEAREVRDLGLGHAHLGDTTHLDAVDREGNMVAATPSGGWLGTSPRDPRAGVSDWHARTDVLSQPGAAQRAGPAQATPRHAHAIARHAQRRAVHGLWHARRRQPGPVDAPVLPQPHPIRYEPARSAGRAHGALGALSRRRSTRAPPTPDASWPKAASTAT